jgi:exopolysaccharide production protein ExoZ
MGTVGVGDSAPMFLGKRIIRIVPLYWLITLAMCAVSLVPGIFSNFTFDMPRLVKSLLFIPHYDPNGNMWPLVVVGWTLDYEMFFYVLFAIGLWLRRPVGATVAMMAALVGAGLLVDVSQPWRFYTDQLLLEFACGLLLAWATGFKGAGIGVVLMAGGAIALLLWGLDSPTPDLRIVFWGLPALAVVAGAVAIDRVGAWPARLLRPLASIGDASYSLYLTHGLVIAFVGKLLKHEGTILFAAIAMAASILVAFASYYLFELPSMRVLRPLLGKSTRRVAVST